MSTDRTNLEEYQAKLLEVLARSDHVEQVQEAFAKDSAFQPFREYTSQFDAAMIQVAMDLTKKWGRVARHS